MQLHPALQSLLQLPSPTLDEQYTYRLPTACPQCQSHLWVAPLSLTCESNQCNWEAYPDPASQIIALVHWLIEEDNYQLQIEVNYIDNSTSIQGSAEHYLTQTTLTPQEVEELLLWL